MSSSRIAGVDLLKALAIFGVVFQHIMGFCFPNIKMYDFILDFIVAWSLPLFVSLSGYCSLGSLERITNIREFSRNLLKKAQAILLPSITGCIIILVATRGSEGLNSFWFLKMLFVVCMVYSFSFLLIRSNGIILKVLLSIIICCLLPIGYSVAEFSTYFGLGLLLRHFNLKALASGKFVLLILLLCLIFYHFNRVSFYLAPFNFYKIINGDLVILKYFACRQALGIILCVLLISISSKIKEVPQWLQEVGKNTLGIYIIQELLMGKYFVCDSQSNLMLFAVLILSVIVIYISLLVIKLLSKVKILRFLILGKK